MRYLSTRGQAPPVSFLDAMLGGMAPDGGLYVPATWPSVFRSEKARKNVVIGHYSYAASHVLKAFAGDDIGWEEDGVAAICNDAYLGVTGGEARQTWPETVAPLRQAGVGDWVLDLSRGPSLSFKDVAMQMIGPLYDLALQRRGTRLTVVCATSGDTGGAAVEALKHRERVDLFVLTPRGRVSAVQRRFMTTSGAPNVHVFEVDGDFDACQALIKALFADERFAAQARLSGVNSINWARIVAQSVYFTRVAHTLGPHGPVNFIVPTGNFGDAYSAWVALQMGAPVGRIVLATNANDILARALETGRYQRTVSRATISPAMDIQVASNFERILFEALDRDAAALRALQEELASAGGFTIPDAALQRLRGWFSAASADDQDTLQQMRSLAEEGDIVCPHTAVGFLARNLVDLQGPVVLLATAHPAKFPETVLQATGETPRLPPSCADLLERPEQFDPLPADLEAVKHVIQARSRAWG
jgi:threonine synthase